MNRSETRYAKTADGVHIAYQVIGKGPPDLVYVPGWISNIDLMWEEMRLANYLRRLTSFARLIVFDKRGTGLSDRVPESELPDLETRMDDVRAVMDQAGSERALIQGDSEGGQMAALFAATYPHRVPGLILYGSDVRGAWAPDHPWSMTVEEFEQDVRRMERGWGTGEYERHFLPQIAPSLADDQRFFEWWTKYSRLSASPGAAISFSRMWYATDVRGILPGISVPTLVLWRSGETWAAESRYLAQHVPGVKAVELDGDDHLPWVGDSEAVLRQIESFAASVLDEEAEFGRVLATVMFTDIVGSTKRAAELGDHRWKQLLEAHNARVRGQLTRYRGQEVDTAGDGFLATFDGPARAVRCAVAIAEAVRPLGLEIRAGVHTGEVEMIDEKIGGLAVVIGARIGAEADASEVLVSQTVKDLVAGSGLSFEPRGEHELKGVPDRWRLYRLVRQRPNVPFPA